MATSAACPSRGCDSVLVYLPYQLWNISHLLFNCHVMKSSILSSSLKATIITSKQPETVIINTVLNTFCRGRKERLVFYPSNFGTASSLLAVVFSLLHKISGFGNRGFKSSSYCGWLITRTSVHNRRITEKYTETYKRSEGIDIQE